MNNADKFAWKFLIDKGSVVIEWNYYAGAYVTAFKKREKCLELIQSVGIDWNKTKPVSDSMKSEFNGTVDDSTYVKVMEGTLVLNDGSKWEFGASDVNPKDIITAMAQYIPDPFEI